MTWQDITLTIANLGFAYGLIALVIQGFKTKKGNINFQTSIITAVGLFIMAITFFSLNLIFSTIVTTISGILWVILIFQRIIYKP